MAVVLTLVQMKQIIYINEIIQNTVNTSTHIIKTPTYNKSNTYTHPHFTKSTHPHITKQVKTIIPQKTHHTKYSQYNQVPSIYCHPNVHGTFVSNIFTITHPLHFKQTNKNQLHINHISSLHITSLIYMHFAYFYMQNESIHMPFTILYHSIPSMYQKGPQNIWNCYKNLIYNIRTSFKLQSPSKYSSYDWMEQSHCCSHCCKHCLKSSTEMLSRAASDTHSTSAMSAKCPPFKSCFIRGYKKKVARSKAGQVRGWDTNTISFLAKNYWMLKAVWAGALSWCKNQSPLCHFSGPFITGSHAVVSTHSSKTADLPFILEEQTPCALYHQYQKNKSSLDT